ncbi:LysM peptidoglycan-binding domain-containing protein [Brevibacillus sp. SYP-B805]|uniref:C40 family peptidase n=1 Tax=Brevibacillus sp. SYP-B805 TaxID=1578199 RepID=UPI0013ED8D44|nr:C40 family peptidase [Brevibacillus sp. SYP-B805]NGQ97338.1 LysM peptidoglycan-binding domain-containing protein [Brevibacillus sp. SYP-B805]
MKKVMKKATFFLFSFTFLFVVPTSAFADTYTVAQGDTLYRIARLYHTTPEALMQQNQLPSDKLAIGQTLEVPGTPQPVPADIPNAPETPVTVSAAPVYAMVNVPLLNVRQNPSTESPILTKVSYGTKLEMIESGPEWTFVKINGQSAYVATPYVSPAADTAAKSFALTQAAPETEGLFKLIEPLLGTKYRTGGTTPDGFDCSGFTSYVMQQLGVTLPRTSEEQFLTGQEVAYEEALPGDLLFYDTAKAGRVTHVALYLGNGTIVHANGENVRFEKVENMNKLYPFYGVKRYLAHK